MAVERRENRVMDKDMFSFVVYMIHACAKQWKQNPSEVYKNMKNTNCIKEFLIPNYEILHTQSTKNMVEDIREYLSFRGIVV